MPRQTHRPTGRFRPIKHSPKRAKFWFCLAACCGVFLNGCNKSEKGEKQNGKDPQTQTSGKKKDNRPKFELPEVAAVLGKIPEFSLTDQEGNSFGSEQLRGQVWVANFIFTTCKSTCPEQTAAMQGIQEQLKSQESNNPALDGINLVSITVDPNTDTPDQLKKYANSHEADNRYWKFLTGSRDDIWELCEKGFMLPVAEEKDNPDNPIAHDPRFVIVDRQMKIRGYFNLNDSLGKEKFKKTFGLVLPEIEATEKYADLFPGDEKVTHLASPPDIATSHWMKARQAAQMASRSSIKAFVDFQFSDQLQSSGISYDPQIVDEQRWRLQVNHYDHGNGVCLCDVDNDGKLDLYFTSQASRNELWRNLGDGRFEDITEKAGVAVDGRISVSAAFGDIDNDGDSDLFVTTIRGGNLLFSNDGKGAFTDVTRQYGVGYQGHSSGAVFFDYDRDGKLDLYVTNVGKYTTEDFEPVRHDRTSSLPADQSIRYYTGAKDAFAGHLKPELDETSILYHNEGDRFVDVTSAMNMENIGWSGDATPIDANNDGWMDLYVCSMQGHDEYFENQGGKSFARKSREVFRRTPWGAMGVKAFDFDNDLNLDLYLTDMHSDMAERVGPPLEKNKSRRTFPDSMLFRIDEKDPAKRKSMLEQQKSNSIFGNAFYKGDGKGGFVEISDQNGSENYWPWGLSVADLNADGFQDAFVASSMCFPYRYGVNSVLINQAGNRFADAEFILGVEPRAGNETIKPWFELDADGADSDNTYCQDRTGKVVVWSALGSRSSAIFDLDNDGDLDIVTSEFNSRPMVLVSNLAEKKKISYLKLRLRGTVSNRDALGAKVILTAGGKKYMQVNDGVSGYLSHSVTPLYFGLGDATEVTEIEISWPNGNVEKRTGPFPVNQLIELVEGQQTKE
ncbi:MAG: FG-GAP-like repeat-containing protein [Planctomycetota bacterium]|nr:FG-GAP-like repeat-containing protein [Planctomycetota bacterium]